MTSKEIVSGLKIALARGESLQKAMQSFVNAGYTIAEVQEAAKEIQTATGMLENKDPKKTVEKPKKKFSLFKKKPKQPKLPKQPKEVKEKIKPIKPLKPKSKKKKWVWILLGTIIGIIIFFIIISLFGNTILEALSG